MSQIQAEDVLLVAMSLKIELTGQQVLTIVAEYYPREGNDNWTQDVEDAIYEMLREEGIVKAVTEPPKEDATLPLIKLVFDQDRLMSEDDSFNVLYTTDMNQDERPSDDHVAEVMENCARIYNVRNDVMEVDSYLLEEERITQDGREYIIERLSQIPSFEKIKLS
jgi:hypothetical protein